MHALQQRRAKAITGAKPSACAVTARSRTATAKIDFTSSDRKTKVLIEAEDIGKTLGGSVLFRDLSLTLSPGVRIGLVGSNGSGKTTLLKILEGQLAPDEGTIRRHEWDGCDKLPNRQPDRACGAG